MRTTNIIAGLVGLVNHITAADLRQGADARVSAACASLQSQPGTSNICVSRLLFWLKPILNEDD